MYREKNTTEYRELAIDIIYRQLKKNRLRFSLSDLKSLLKSDFIPTKNPFVEYFNNLPEWDILLLNL